MPTDDRFRAVLIGAGKIGAEAHLPALLACQEIDLVAIVDPVRERAERLARQYGLSTPVFADVGPALAGAEGAVIATPNQTHLAIAKQCLESGVAVLIEKPMTSTYEEARELERVARDTRKLVMVGYVTRHRPNVLLLKSLLASGHFGRVRRFAYQYGTVGGWAPLSGYRPQAGGGGVLAVTGSHFLDRMIWLWGYPTRSDYRDDGDSGPEANAIAEFTFAEGLEGIVRCSKTAQLPGGLVLDTEAGRVTLLDYDGVDIVLCPNRDPSVRYLVQGEGRSPSVRGAFAEQVAEFAAACRGRPSDIGCSLEQGAESVRLMDELYSKRRPLSWNWRARMAT